MVRDSEPQIHMNSCLPTLRGLYVLSERVVVLPYSAVDPYALRGPREVLQRPHDVA